MSSCDVTLADILVCDVTVTVVAVAGGAVVVLRASQFAIAQ